MPQDQTTPKYSFHKDQATLRPWHIKDKSTVLQIEAINDWVLDINNPNEIDKANARLIVKAVNCHDELKNCLGVAIIALKQYSCNPSQISILEQALARAEKE